MRLAVLTDLHLVAPAAAAGRRLRFHNRYELESGPAILTAAVEAAVEAGADVIVLLGDLVNDGDPEMLALALREAARAGLPVWAVAGNHDAILGAGALRQAVDASGPDVIALDAEPVRLSGFTVVAVPVTTDDGGESARALPAVGPRPPGEGPLLVVSHCPLLSFAEALGAAGYEYAGDLANREETARAVLAGTGPTVVVSGHLHARAQRAEGAVLQLVFSALVEEPHEIAVVDVEAAGDAVRVAIRTVRVFAAAGPGDGTERPAALLAASPVTWVTERGGPWRCESGAGPPASAPE